MTKRQERKTEAGEAGKALLEISRVICKGKGLPDLGDREGKDPERIQCDIS